MELRKPIEGDLIDPSVAARELSKLGASKGGRARAESLSQVERTEIARKAADARWSSRLPKATHTGELNINGVLIPCAVLDDQTRVLTQRGFSVALGRYKNPKRKGAIVELPVFLAANNLKDFVDEELVRSSIPISFRMAEGSGGLGGNAAIGYRADLLPQVCKVYLRAQQEDKLRRNQEHIAERCLILLEGLATVGITALVDEATGYQADRAADALEKILQKFISKELCKWAWTFKPSFYRELFRLRNIKASEFSASRPQYIGHITNDIVYKRLAPGVLDELRRLTPKDEKGRRKHQLHRRLTRDQGHPQLREHLASLVTIMKLSENWDDFYERLEQIHPVWTPQKRLAFAD